MNRQIGLVLCFIFSCIFSSGANAAIINPETIEVLAFVSFGEKGAAWLKANDKEILVSPGYILSKDLRVTAIKHEGVVLYQELAKKYFVPTTNVPDSLHRHREDVVWCMPMKLWKIIRMVALAYRKDYICHFETRVESTPRSHVVSMNEMLEKCVSPHHRFHGREGIIYVSPVHIRATDWTWFLEQVRVFHGERLSKWFPTLKYRGSVISDGKDLFDILKDIEYKTGVSIKWDRPFPMPIYCSIKDRPWHQILENILIYNGLSLYPQNNQLVVSQGWQ